MPTATLTTSLQSSELHDYITNKGFTAQMKSFQPVPHLYFIICQKKFQLLLPSKEQCWTNQGANIPSYNTAKKKSDPLSHSKVNTILNHLEPPTNQRSHHFFFSIFPDNGGSKQRCILFTPTPHTLHPERRKSLKSWDDSWPNYQKKNHLINSILLTRVVCCIKVIQLVQQFNKCISRIIKDFIYIEVLSSLWSSRGETNALLSVFC